MNNEPNKIEIDGTIVELNVDPSQAPSVLRAFLGATPSDREVDALPVPTKPLWLKFCVGLLRWYRSIRPARISQRCVFDPSCSRYSELAFRKHGFFRGFYCTIKRLLRCKRGSGGTDIP